TVIGARPAFHSVPFQPSSFELVFLLLRSHCATGARPTTLRKASESSTPFRQCLCRSSTHPCPNVATKGENSCSLRPKTNNTRSERSTDHATIRHQTSARRSQVVSLVS